MRRSLSVALVVLLTGIGLTAEKAPAPQVKIGMLKSMVREVPPALFKAMAAPFQQVVYDQTGLKGDLVVVETPEQMQQQLVDGDIQLGVFHGFEYAWMKMKQPKLEPLMLVAINPQALQTVVVVNAENTAKSIDECRGCRLAIPHGTREHCRLFLNRRCRKCGCEQVQDIFPHTDSPKSVEEALDQVVDNQVQVAVVDQAGLAMFQRRKPGRFAKLRMLDQSEHFPPSVIVFSKGQLDDPTLQRFRNGMATAHKTTLGSHLMGLMKITGFEPVPGNYDQRLAEIVKAYPPPW
jgi:ABC-type phosphate/phosphonate transport system substrate-binding protein